MSQAVVDPNELRRFAANLKKFSTELQEQLNQLNSQLHALANSWRDAEHQKFVDEFEHNLKGFARFIEVTSEHAPFLVRKAERIEEYLQQR